MWWCWTKREIWTPWCAAAGLLVSMLLSPGPVLLGIAAGLLAWNGACVRLLQQSGAAT